jgi:hypothetical protein
VSQVGCRGPRRIKVGGAGICTYPASVTKVTESRAFLVKLLMGTTFDVFINSARFRPSAPTSTAFVEVFWRRREGLPGAKPEATSLRRFREVR